MPAKPVIKLRPTTKRVEPVSPELTDTLEDLSKENTVDALDLEQLARLDQAFYRPNKKQISIRMDADVLAWFQSQPGKYQQLMNKACRIYMNLKRAATEVDANLKEI